MCVQQGRGCICVCSSGMWEYMYVGFATKTTRYSTSQFTGKTITMICAAREKEMRENVGGCVHRAY